MSETTIRVLIADDHTVVRKGLQALLSAEKYGIEVIGEASNGEEAIQKAGESGTRCDPDGSGDAGENRVGSDCRDQANAA